jgi:hypothetical protein
MENLNGDMKTSVDPLPQLEAENRLLREEIQQLRAEKATAQLKLEQQQAIGKKHQEIQSRFHAIFYESK